MCVCGLTNAFRFGARPLSIGQAGALLLSSQDKATVALIGRSGEERDSTQHHSAIGRVWEITTFNNCESRIDISKSYQYIH